MDGSHEFCVFTLGVIIRHFKNQAHVNQRLPRSFHYNLQFTNGLMCDGDVELRLQLAPTRKG